MSNIDKRALREAAEKATPGRIGDRVDGSIKYTCRGTDGTLVLSTDNHDDYGFVGDNSLEDELFFRLCDPVTVLALLDELEAKDKSIGFLKDQLAQLANFNPDWDKLEAATDSLREHMAKLSSAEKRIAELEARDKPKFVQCWSCKHDIEVLAIADCDGYFPRCAAPIDLDDEPYAGTAKGE
ncbi:ead/Ea22-like family protein [Enterobacter kobei]|uniref:ead/Ea22-like family protein n=1 Tax=Enterobacter kobei TaxID=208224 RepID=UPI0039670BEC